MKKETKAVLLLLLTALLNVSLLSAGHALGHQMLLLGAIALFAGLVVVTDKAYYLPLTMFYLPWSSLLRTDPAQSSVHTLVLPVVFLIVVFNWLRKDPDLKQGYFLWAVFLVSYTLVVKFFNGLPLHNPYLFFMLMLFFVPVYLQEYGKRLSFVICTVFLTAGNISASLASALLIDNPNILPYVDINTEMGIGLRLSSFYGDANYYSAQLLVAIAGLLILLFKLKNKLLVLPLVGAVAALLYFALGAVSKMFILCLILITVLWAFNLLLENRPASYKLGIISVMVVIASVIAAQNLFAEQINYYVLRFSSISDPISLTTGRTVLWRIYLDYLLTHVDKLFFGIGLSADQVRILLRINNAHMTLIEVVYQLGITGAIMLFMWWKSVYQGFVVKVPIKLSDWLNLGIMATAIFLPWLALDILYFREFFYSILLLFLLRNYLAEKAENSRAG